MLSTAVTKVDTSDKRVCVYTDKGHAMKFDEVVFTAPLGWLKKNHAKVFFPSLPQRMSQAINNIGYGNLEKVGLS
jgi:monoamine oxidase